MDADKRILLVERELGDKLFLLIWVATIIQFLLVSIDWVNLIYPPFSMLVPFLRDAKATELTTDAYLAIQLAYMGKKELTRWFGKRSTSTVETEELVRRIRKGDSAVLIWGLAYLAGVFLVALHVTAHPPSELQRTFIQVVTIYTLAFVSKSAQKKQSRNSVRDDEKQAVDAGIPDKEMELLSLIKEKNGVSVSECMEHCGMSKNNTSYILKKLVASGAIQTRGKGKATIYTSARNG